MALNILEKMKAEGWQQRFTASGARLKEAIDNYQALGLEVKTISVKELVSDGCTVCFDDDSDETVMIFTRETAESTSGNLNNDLE